MKKGIIIFAVVALVAVLVYFFTKKPKATNEADVVNQQIKQKADEIKAANPTIKTADAMAVAAALASGQVSQEQADKAVLETVAPTQVWSQSNPNIYIVAGMGRG